MDLSGWNARYLERQRPLEEGEAAPTPLLAEAFAHVEPGRALDLACGTGRNALWLAKRGWKVTAIDGAPAAIAQLEMQAQVAGVHIETQVADLQSPTFTIAEESWDLIAFLYYLQRDLFSAIRHGVVPGGRVVGIVHTTFPGEEPTAHRCRPNELESYFEGWEILHRYEGAPKDPEHKRLVAEVVARRPQR